MNEQHLRCTRCDSSPTVARLDGLARIVCHCTHVDGPIEPVAVDELEHALPDAWTFM